mgnify:CR=1 FL=1
MWNTTLSVDFSEKVPTPLHSRQSKVKVGFTLGTNSLASLDFPLSWFWNCKDFSLNWRVRTEQREETSELVDQQM